MVSDYLAKSGNYPQTRKSSRYDQSYLYQAGYRFKVPGRFALKTKTGGWDSYPPTLYCVYGYNLIVSAGILVLKSRSTQVATKTQPRPFYPDI